MKIYNSNVTLCGNGHVYITANRIDQPTTFLCQMGTPTWDSSESAKYELGNVTITILKK